MEQIKVCVCNSAGVPQAIQEGADAVSLVYTAEYKDGDYIQVDIAREKCHCVIQLEDTFPPALVYVRDHTLRYPIPDKSNRNNICPKSFQGQRHLIRVSMPSEQEVMRRRNLAVNPYDSHESEGFYPHASANVETRNEVVFAASNAIDGMYENTAHGIWPFQSWGINRDPNAALKVDFGHPVWVDELRLTLRADFPHDSWWKQGTVSFSDGSSETLELKKSGAVQCFEIAPRKVEWLVLEKLIKAEDESPFPALTEIEAWGVPCDEADEKGAGQETQS